MRPQSLRNQPPTGAARLDSDSLRRRAHTAHAPTEIITAIEALPDGRYTLDEVERMIAQRRAKPEATRTSPNASPHELPDHDLLHQLFTLHRIRNDRMLRDPDEAFARNTARVRELEREYLRRLLDRVPVD